MAGEKHTLRQQCQDRRLALSSETRKAASRKICDLLLRLPEYAAARTVALYAADAGEVDLQGVFQCSVTDRKSCFFPEVVGGAMDFRRVTQWSDLVPGRFGILAPPKTTVLLAPAQCDMVIVPGVAFDRQGNRLGRGKGYYDRYLPQVRGCRVGVSFDVGVCESLPHEPHDVRMDVLITESGVVRFNSPPPMGEG
jgi:5-formyltetrahydrofolate cyclo-ligase